MKLLAVLTATLACVLAEPGLWAGGVTTYTNVVGAPIAAPLAAAPFAAPFAAAPFAAAAVAAPLAAAPVAAPVAAVAAPVAAVAAPVAAVAAPVATQSKYHFQDAIGQASYGHAEPFQTHNAVQDAAGNKIGSFSYLSPEGNVFRTDYVADALGYRVASNALPVGPSAPAAVGTAILARRRRSVVGPVAVGHTPASTAPLGAPLAATIAAPVAAPYAAPYAAPWTVGYTPAATAPLAASYAAPWAFGYTPAATAPLAAPYAARIAAPYAAPLAVGYTPASTAPLGAIAAPVVSRVW